MKRNNDFIIRFSLVNSKKSKIIKKGGKIKKTPKVKKAAYQSEKWPSCSVLWA